MDELKDYIAKQKKGLAVFTTSSDTDDRITITFINFILTNTGVTNI